MGKPKKNSKSDPNVSSNRDRCQTPSYALLPLVPYLDRVAASLPRPWKKLNVWEPAAGAGLLVEAFGRHGYNVASGDLLTGQNYFDDESVPSVYDVQVTNPPYGAQVKYRWIRTAYRRGKPFALLLPFETWAAKQAQVLFEKHGVEVVMFDERIDFHMPNAGYVDGGANFATAWFTWGLNIGRTVSYAKIGKAKAEYAYQIAHQARQENEPALFAFL